MGSFSRRTFIKSLSLAAGASLVGRVHAQSTKSRVVVVTDGRAWKGLGWTDADLDRQVLSGMLRRALVELTAREDASLALASLIPGLLDSAPRIGIKVNCVNDDLPTHPGVVLALVDLLSQAGGDPDKILVYDRTDRELAACGYRLNTGQGLKVFGSDHHGVGHADEAVSLTDSEVKLSRIVTHHVDHLINVPILKNHQMTDVTLSLKNHFGSINRPMGLHGARRDCSPGIAELYARPEIRDRSRLVLIDATFATHVSGLGARPDFAPMTLIAATDPVAADWVGQAIINARRASEGLSALDAKHIHDASALGLGTNDPHKIERLDLMLHEVKDKPKNWEKESNGCATADPDIRVNGAGCALGAASAVLAFSQPKTPQNASQSG